MTRLRITGMQGRIVYPRGGLPDDPASVQGFFVAMTNANPRHMRAFLKSQGSYTASKIRMSVAEPAELLRIERA